MSRGRSESRLYGAGLSAGLLLLGAPLLADPAAVIREVPVQPLTRYALTLETAPGSGPGAWSLQVFTADQDLPHDGVFKGDWQRMVPGQTSYVHEFRTPRDGALLKVVLESPGKLPAVTQVRLEPVTNADLVINGRFACGPDNYSGWNDRARASLETNATGARVLRCEADGYAVTDPIPVEPGSVYRFANGSYGGGRILVYDRDLLQIGRIDNIDPVKNPAFTVPAEAAYIRIAYCDGRTWSGRVPVISGVGLERVSTGSVPERPVLPAYPGEIIVAPGADLPEVRAARELSHWVRMISGREMRVLAQPSGGKNFKLFVGRAWAEGRFADDLRSLEGSDGFAVRREGQGVYVFGARSAGALFGAIRLLEKNSDLLFARPNPECGTFYTPDPNLAFTNADFRERPAFQFRAGMGTYTQPWADNAWQGRAGMNSSPSLYNRFERMSMGGMPSYDANFMMTISQSPRYAFERCRVEHPEFFARVNGKRQIAPQGYTCFTAPGVAEALAEGLGAVVDRARARGENLENIGVRTRDGWTVCSCETCMQPIALPDGSLLRPKADTADADPLFFSTRMALMLNRMGEAFARTHPGLPVTVPAYIYSAVPPAIWHATNLVPSFCAYDTCSLRFPILDGAHNVSTAGRLWEERFREYLRRNGQGGRMLSMFAYYYCAGFSAVADSAAADWSAMLRSGGVQGIQMDGFTPDTTNGVSPWDYQGLEKWVMARLMWDPEQDPQALREAYIRKAFGRAAPEMLAFYNGIREVWTDPAIPYGPNCHALSSDLFDTLIVKTGREAPLRALLASAEAKAERPDSRLLIRRTLQAFDGFAQSLNRIYIPLVPEIASEWQNADSTLWVQGLKLGPFKRVSTWDDFNWGPASNATAVAVLRDRDHLYLRYLASGPGASDRVELLLSAGRGKPTFYFGLDRDGRRSVMKDFAAWSCTQWSGEVQERADGYAALFKVPLAVLPGLDLSGDSTVLYAKCSRLAGEGPECEESSLTGAALSRIHYLNYWTALSIARDGRTP